MRIYLLIFLANVLALTACWPEAPEGYSHIAHGIRIRKNRLGEGSYYPKPLDYVSVRISFDRAAQVPETSISQWEGTRNFQLSYEAKKCGIEYAITRLTAGDSATFLIPKSCFKAEETGDLKVGIDLLAVIPADEYRERMEDVAAWEAELENIETVRLQEYLDEKHPGLEAKPQGWFEIKLKEGTGDRPATGKVIQIHYAGYFLDETEFDNSRHQVTPFEFEWGSESQLIPGIISALSGMREGGKSRIIVPSHLAFGKKGSSTGLVPPNTTLIYEIELISVK